MAGSSPNPPRPARRRRAAKPLMPWVLISILFLLYVLMGLLLSVPAPPYWIWVLVVLGIPLIAVGLSQPALSQSALSQQSARLRLLTYPGALLLVVALAIAANYIGSNQDFDNVRFFVALLGLVVLTLLAVMLTAAAVVVSAQIGDKLIRIVDYRQRLTVLMGAGFVGVGVGGLAGFLSKTL
ncbi:hypothetical protein [Leptolyngbya sp. BC1307]|uniref:hypothetical protein n=1 Tax=Leptolyngbya sp. BC1307 TaxID=2029589 RepID=UPI000EFAC15D|nr:hypothetical protein [Leptolyngbya sp. BC1307]